MTSPISVPPLKRSSIGREQRRAARGVAAFRRAFTLIELLVVIGIIAVLASILVPMVNRSYTTAARTRAKLDLKVIEQSLENYRQDFGDYPRVFTEASGVKNGLLLPNTGAAVLCRALLGPFGDGTVAGDPPPLQANASYKPGDCVTESSGNYYIALIQMESGSAKPISDDTAWEWFDPHDGANGPGFKNRAGASKTWGPYIDPAKTKNQGIFLLDSYGGPILYFPGRVGRGDISKNYVLNISGIVPPNTVMPLYNAADNFEVFRRGAAEPKTNPANQDKMLYRIRVTLGDTNFNGSIDGSGEIAINQPYLLWSAGPDGQFGPAGLDFPAGVLSSDQISAIQAAVAKCDDVGNFRE